MCFDMTSLFVNEWIAVSTDVDTLKFRLVQYDTFYNGQNLQENS